MLSCTRSPIASSNMALAPDTIAAVATPPGRGGIGIVRVSGPLVETIARSLVGCEIVPRQAAFCAFKDGQGEVIDRGIALFFPGPTSFTGEDTLEVQGHGGPVVMDMLLQRTLELGARVARPGEFSERAFLNGKVDLTQAEAIADLIDSASQQAARCAMRSLEGGFSSKTKELVNLLVDLRTSGQKAFEFIYNPGRSPLQRGRAGLPTSGRDADCHYRPAKRGQVKLVKSSRRSGLCHRHPSAWHNAGHHFRGNSD